MSFFDGDTIERNKQMNIILLSGGSGKRLWPLSNNVRSKQFIQIFKNQNNHYESMLQRVYRQITEVDKDSKIIIATNKAQISAIHNQLEDRVDICAEPCRRDTFPAILLAVVFLFYERNINRDEVVVVCPVDPYVENSYYDGIAMIAELAEHGSANITLMGIEPTYPSEKYGYIIPSGTEQVSQVSEFKEKPTAEMAADYIRQGALWNAGVFAFKLGYLLDKAHDMIDFTNYKEFLAKYDTLPKISFDYAVVEKEDNIQVMRYAGDWRDVGTWNMMAEVMSDSTKGNVILDETCENTNVVNELNLPILCMGCKNMVVAASGDGILISDKERSGYIKPYVDKISSDVMFAEKSWGTYTVLDAQPHSMTVRLLIKAGCQMSYHYHEHRDEVWTILNGTGKVILNGTESIVKQGMVVSIPNGYKHTIVADTDLTLVEIQMGEEICMMDKYKVELYKN